MAIQTCKACGKTKSSKDDVCPHCGNSPARRQRPVAVWIAVLLIVIGVVPVALLVSGDRPEAETSPVPPPSGIPETPATPPGSNAPDSAYDTGATKTTSAIPASEPADLERRQLIEQLIAENVFAKVDTPAGLPRIWVTEKFHALDPKTKKKIAVAIYDYHFDGDELGKIVIVRDNESGEDIGLYQPQSGLVLK